RTPIGVPVPASPSATARTVPSPPAAMTTDAPCSSACRTWPPPGSSTVVSSHSGSASPDSAATSVTSARSRAPSVPLDGLKTTAGGPLGRSPRAGSGSSWEKDGVRRRSARQATRPTVRPATAMTSAMIATHCSQPTSAPYWLSVRGAQRRRWAGGWTAAGQGPPSGRLVLGVEARDALAARPHADLAGVEGADRVHVGADVPGHRQRGSEPRRHGAAVDEAERHGHPGLPRDPVEAGLPVPHRGAGALGRDDEVGRAALAHLADDLVDQPTGVVAVDRDAPERAHERPERPLEQAV